MAALDLFREMENLRREVDEAFRSFGMGGVRPPSFLPGLSTGDYPLVNLSEDENNVLVRALVPGLAPEDIQLNAIKGALTIAGERRATDPAGKTWFRRERGTGQFMRAVNIPADLATERASADYRNGILTVTLPKAEDAKPKKITVNPN